MHIMPIITPFYPQFNTSVNVIPSTLKHIKREFRRAYEILRQSNEDSLGDIIKDLYSPLDITSEYSLFLRLDIMSKENSLTRWVGIIQIKLRSLLLSLQNVKNLKFRLFPTVYENEDELTKTILIGLKYKEIEGKENIPRRELINNSKESQTQKGIQEGDSKLNEESKEDATHSKFDEKYNISDSLNIVEEIKSFTENIDTFRNPLAGDNIKIKLVDRFTDLKV
mmetsp:Transcript_32693/g.28954  ORF Transcript_32693/g.28954 Transcript_32693/m.28954 type:complete len:224 (+) Transcript_32693:925-1596(+)